MADGPLTGTVDGCSASNSSIDAASSFEEFNSIETAANIGEQRDAPLACIEATACGVESMEEEESSGVYGENEQHSEGDDSADGDESTTHSSSVSSDSYSFLDVNDEFLETLNFDFEALPPALEDLDGLVDLLTQLFLRVDSIDLRNLARRIVDQSPFGCVYRPAEEFEDDEESGRLYGVLSIVGINDDNSKQQQRQKCQLIKSSYQTTIADHILQRAVKFAPKQLTKRLKHLLSCPHVSTDSSQTHPSSSELLSQMATSNKSVPGDNDDAQKMIGQEICEAEKISNYSEPHSSGVPPPPRPPLVGLVLNERLLHFPSQIAGPAFQSLRNDYQAISSVRSTTASSATDNNPPSTTRNAMVPNKKDKKKHQKAVDKIVEQGSSRNAPSSSSSQTFQLVQEEQQLVKRYDFFLMVLKIRVNYIEQQNKSSDRKTKKKKQTKAEKRKQLAANLAQAETLFDNPEEKLLFHPVSDPGKKRKIGGKGTSKGHSPSTEAGMLSTLVDEYFDYPVESDVERGSKFHCTRRQRDGAVFRPYRRVCILTAEQFLAFCDQVAA